MKQKESKEEGVSRELACWKLCTPGGLVGDGVSYKESCTPNPCGIVFVATSLNKLQSGNSFYF